MRLTHNQVNRTSKYCPNLDLTGFAFVPSQVSPGIQDIKVDADITVLTDPEEAVVVLSAPVAEEVAEEEAPTEDVEKVTE